MKLLSLSALILAFISQPMAIADEAEQVKRASVGTHIKRLPDLKVMNPTADKPLIINPEKLDDDLAALLKEADQAEFAD